MFLQDQGSAHNSSQNYIKCKYTTVQNNMYRTVSIKDMDCNPLCSVAAISVTPILAAGKVCKVGSW